MIIDMHTRAGKPSRAGPVNRAVLRTMQTVGGAAAVVAAIAGLSSMRRNPETPRPEKIGNPEPAGVFHKVRAV